MPKYHLVASYYDMYEKDPKLRYKDEVEVNLSDINLSTLQDIDSFTASHTHLELLQILSKNGITGKNQLAIKFQSNKTANPEHLRVIENTPEFIPCTKENETINYWALGENIRSLGVPQSNPLFIAEKDVLLTLLEQGNEEELKKKFPFPKSLLYRLIDEYFNGAHDNDTDKELVKKTIQIEFSRYKTFRGWIIVKKNQMHYERKNTFVKSEQQQVPKTLPKNIVPKTQEEYETEFEKNFNDNHKINYASHQTHQFNTSRLDSDKEEFLSVEEHESIYETMPTYPSTKAVSKIRKKKPLRTSRSYDNY